MRLPLLVVALAALLTAAAGTSAAPRIWLDGPTTVQGVGFPQGKVVVAVRGTRAGAIRVVRATAAGRFTARFDKPVASSSCTGMTVITAVGASGVRAGTKTPPAKICPPPLQP
jgi:hypothetical protein